MLAGVPQRFRTAATHGTPTAAATGAGRVRSAHQGTPHGCIVLFLLIDRPHVAPTLAQVRNSQMPGVNGYLVGPIVGPDRSVDGTIKQPQRMRLRRTDPLLIKRTDSIAHRFGVERYSSSRSPSMPLVAIDLAGRARRQQLMVERRSASTGPPTYQERPGSGQTARSSMSWATSHSASTVAGRSLSGPRGHFFVRPESVPLLSIPARAVGDVAL